jgi:3-isopropylmalate/(R)-2-methylmalate dehydratase large subunit
MAYNEKLTMNGMTITEKILARHAGRERVAPGELLLCRVDLALANDITAPLAIAAFREAGASRVWDRHRVALVPDHFTPNKDVQSAEQARVVRDFAREQEITHYFEVGRMGVEHALLPEQGLVRPGELLVGADSHTCTHGALGAFATGIGSTDLAAVLITGEIWLRVPESMKIVFTGRRRPWVGGKDLILHLIGRIGVDGATYRALEFGGDALADLPMDDRLALCNMAVEAGAKNGIIAPDAVTRDYLAGVGAGGGESMESDPDAPYLEVLTIDVSSLEPQVAFPHLPSNVRPVGEAGEVTVDQVFIGSCTNGRLTDLREAARVLRGRKVHPRVRLIVIPATPTIYRQAMDEGLFHVFLDAGAAVSTPTCGPCLGGHMGILAAGERAAATSNRNFLGRMGHPSSEIYLVNPAVAAATAVAGRIVSPDALEGGCP